MNYYINQQPKNDFYFLGKITPTEFIEGHGMKFIKEYLSEFPFLVDEVKVIDETSKVITMLEFFDKIKN